MIFTPDKIKRMLEIIDMNHIMFSLRVLGDKSIPKEDIDILKRYGIDYKTLLQEHPEMTKSFHWGRLAQALGKQAKEVDESDFNKYLKRGQYIPLNESEEYALEYAEKKTYHHIKNLGERVKEFLGMKIIESSPKLRASFEEIIRDSVKMAVEERESAAKIVSEIGHKTGDWNRDLGRIAETELNNVYQLGRAEQIKRQSGNKSLVFKDVFPGACRYCISAYTTNGIGSAPKIFTLEELISNGTNIGRKAEEWEPVLESMHPHSITDKKTSILTDKGWKQICKIEVGDMVLTHKGRFRKVTDTLKDYPIPLNDPNYKMVYTIYYSHFNNKDPDEVVKLNFTGDHKLLTNKGWVQVKDLTTSHKLKKLLKKCVVCDNYLESYQRESRSCCSVECTNKYRTINAYSQWGNYSNEEIKELKFKISEKVKENWENGLHKNTLDNLKSEGMREFTKNRMLTGGAIKALEAQGGRITSKEQLKLYEMVLRLFPEAELEYKIFNRSLDIALVNYKIDIEFDGSFWHEDRKDDDLIRDNLLKSNDWHVLRYTDNIPKLGVLRNDIETIIQNHKGEYKFVETDILFIKRNWAESGMKLYDLTVEEDESFIARGVVVHNCRCQLENVPKGYLWDKEKKRFELPNMINDNTYGQKGTIKILVGDKIFYV